MQRKSDPFARGDPQSALSWTCRSAARLAAELRTEGPAGSERSVNRLLHGLGYRLQVGGMTLEGRQRPDRDAQFRHISQRVAEFQATCQPVVSVDAKTRPVYSLRTDPLRGNALFNVPLGRLVSRRSGDVWKSNVNQIRWCGRIYVGRDSCDSTTRWLDGSSQALSLECGDSSAARGVDLVPRFGTP